MPLHRENPVPRESPGPTRDSAQRRGVAELHVMTSGNARDLNATRVGEKRATPMRAAQYGSANPALRANPEPAGRPTASSCKWCAWIPNLWNACVR
ncbi:hypothetical protein L3H42_07155 [Corynebacterium sp. MC-13]|nr:hypothetical protein [Corynebacterium parakroppenstedtii]MCF8701196.1 hypothetical protein [Corynebacterium parakroppenstedtii]